MLEESIALAELAATITSVSSADEALKLFDQQNFDIIVMDWHLIGVTADEIVETLRAACPSVPVVVLTGEPRSLDYERARRAGIEEIIPKPMTLEAWEAVANTIIAICEGSPARAA